MIKGFNLDFTAHELLEHAKKMVAHHQGRLKWYSERIDDLEAGGVNSNDGASNDPIRGLKSSRDTHTERIGYFQLVAEHLVDGETYRLSDSDMRTLGLLKGRW